MGLKVAKGEGDAFRRRGEAKANPGVFRRSLQPLQNSLLRRSLRKKAIAFRPEHQGVRDSRSAVRRHGRLKRRAKGAPLQLQPVAALQRVEVAIVAFPVAPETDGRLNAMKHLVRQFDPPCRVIPVQWPDQLSPTDAGPGGGRIGNIHALGKFAGEDPVLRLQNAAWIRLVGGAHAAVGCDQQDRAIESMAPKLSGITRADRLRLCEQSSRLIRINRWRGERRCER